MKKVIWMLMMLALLVCLPACGAWAQSEQPITVKLNDGAPIPYFEGFQSSYIKSVVDIQGVTGAVDVKAQEFVDSSYGDYVVDFHVTNIALTDDLFILFATETKSTSILYFGDEQYSWDNILGAPDVNLDGEYISRVYCYEEHHPVGDVLYSMFIWSLPKPIEDGQILTIGADWNVEKQCYEGGTQVVIDRSGAKDSTKASAPNQQVKKKVEYTSYTVNYDFVVERVAQTPIGNRLLLKFNATHERNCSMDGARLLDENGGLIPMVSADTGFREDLSKAHPAQMYQEFWFVGDENYDTLTLVPTNGLWLPVDQTARTVVLPMDSLPADIALEDGGTLHMEDMQVVKDGLWAHYTLKNSVALIRFDLLGKDGQRLGLTTSGTIPFLNRLTGQYEYSRLLADELDGRIVSSVPEYLTEDLIIEYNMGDSWLMMEDAIDIPTMLGWGDQ